MQDITMKTRVYYQVFSDTQPCGISCGQFATAKKARDFITGELARYQTMEKQENIDYWTAYANALRINKVIELIEEVL